MMIEGTWLGYRSSQDQIIFRAFYPKKFTDQVSKICPVITFTDGTRLLLTISDAKPSKKRKVIHNYEDLIRRCVTHGVDNVTKLYELEAAKTIPWHQSDLDARYPSSPLLQTSLSPEEKRNA